MGDLRRTKRVEHKGRVSLSWSDSTGAVCSCLGDCIDLSAAGMRVRVPSPVPNKAYVALRFKEAGLHGAASVKSCSRKGLSYAVGLEFTSGLRWSGLIEKTNRPD